MATQVLPSSVHSGSNVAHMHEQNTTQEINIFKIFQEIVLKVLANRDIQKDESAEKIFRQRQEALAHTKNASRHTIDKSTIQLLGRVINLSVLVVGAYFKLESETIQKVIAPIILEIANFYATFSKDELITLEQALSQMTQSERSAKLQQQSDSSGIEKTLMDSLATCARSDMNPNSGG